MISSFLGFKGLFLKGPMLIYFFFFSHAKRIFRFYLTWQFTVPGWNMLAGHVLSSLNCPNFALTAYERAAVGCRSEGSRKAFRFTQQCHFTLERAWARAQSKPRVDDPLLEASCVSSNWHSESTAAGTAEAGFTHLGLRLDGFVTRKATRERHLELWLDDRCIRTLPLHRKSFIPPYFHFQIKREVLARFPKKCRLSVRTVEGDYLGFGRAAEVEVTLPHGDGSIFDYLAAGGRIDKKGFLALTPDTIHARQQRYLTIYSQAREYFTHTFGSSLFLMYGTLLGHVREGDFIQGDDDFDAGYLSHKTTAAEVKQETMQLVVDLVLAGFTCSFNRNGRLFRLRLKDDKPDVHLDVRPVWYEDGHIWAHKQARLTLQLSDFEPVRTETLRGVAVDIPKHPERFLAAYYGEGWKVPDPAFSNASQKVPRFVKRKLNSVCITPADYQQMQAQIESRRGEYPEAGKLIATGLHPLYPLEEYEANCEW